MLKSYFVLLIHKFILFALTTNDIIIFIMYLYLYLLKSLYLLEFIVISNFIQLECIYSICISTVFIGIIFIFIGLDLIFFYSIHVL